MLRPEVKAMLTVFLFGVLACLAVQVLYKKYKAAKEQAEYLDSLARNWDRNVKNQTDFMHML